MRILIFRFNTEIFDGASALFETLVLKKFPKEVELFIKDYRAEPKLSEWIQEYKISGLRSSNTEVVKNISETKHVTTLELHEVKSFSSVDPLFKKESRIKSLKIYFTEAVVENKAMLKKWIDLIKIEDLFPYLIFMKIKSGLILEEKECFELNQRKENKEFLLKTKNKNLSNLEMLEMIIQYIKENGVDNVVREISIVNVFKFSETQMEKVIKFSERKKYIESFVKKEIKYLKLLKERIEEDEKEKGKEDHEEKVDDKEKEKKEKEENEKLMREIIAEIKKNKMETEEGFLYMTKRACIEIFEMKESKIEKILKLGKEKGLLKQEMRKVEVTNKKENSDAKEESCIVYTDERRVDVSLI